MEIVIDHGEKIVDLEHIATSIEKVTISWVFGFCFRIFEPFVLNLQWFMENWNGDGEKIMNLENAAMFEKKIILQECVGI